MANGADMMPGSSVIPFVDRVNEIHKDLVIWIAIDGILMVCIFSGNILTIIAVWYYRRLQWLISNLFVLSLAISDIFVGLTLPYHLAFYMGVDLGRQKHLCLLRFFVLIIACSVSIWNLIAIAVDRYIAICYPLHYTRLMTKRTALTILGFGWCLAISIATIPLIWNKWDTAQECEFDELLHPWYVAGVITPIFSVVWLCLFVVYWRIWREASKHAKQLRAHGGASERSSSDWKSVQVVLLIMGCFTFCWIPYFVVVLTQIFAFVEDSSPTLYKAAFSLAMANSMMNPIIYAWKNTHFRHAFKQLLTCHKPVVPLDVANGVGSFEMGTAKSCPEITTESFDPVGGMIGAAAATSSTLTNHSSLASVSTVATVPAAEPGRFESVVVISQLAGGDRVRSADITANTTIRVSLSNEELPSMASNRDGSIQTNAPEVQSSVTSDPPATSPFPPTKSSSASTNVSTHIIAGNIIINNFNLYDQARMERLLRQEWTASAANGTAEGTDPIIVAQVPEREIIPTKQQEVAVNVTKL
ncbi:adenosine receptor A2b [Anopheles maculipalpis]|uniref:adenosine receptor A2b n=1 Tax=Anopheles maculipalpis TaxID=1496333 RepID=UPI002158B73F|nr:adenosine receptor A2b [Anopheles maculipalpis]